MDICVQCGEEPAPWRDEHGDPWCYRCIMALELDRGVIVWMPDRWRDDGDRR